MKKGVSTQAWSALSSDTFDISLSDISLFNDELYVTGSFLKINSDSIQNIAKFTGETPFGIVESEKSFSFSVFPNPVNNSLTISFHKDLKTYRMITVNGLRTTFLIAADHRLQTRFAPIKISIQTFSSSPTY